MEFQPDKRHLWGGLALAILLSVWIVYKGMSDTGAAYYLPEHEGHPKGSSYAAECGDCHTVAWKEIDNGSCIVCHTKRAARKKVELGQRAPAPPPEQPGKEKHPTHPASDRLHELVIEESCASCHLEHRESPLDALLKVKIEARKKDPGYPRVIHEFIPEKFRGQDSCVVCHTQAELDAVAQQTP